LLKYSEQKGGSGGISVKDGRETGRCKKQKNVSGLIHDLTNNMLGTLIILEMIPNVMLDSHKKIFCPEILVQQEWDYPSQNGSWRCGLQTIGTHISLLLQDIWHKP
jgi:hypothetical protein